MEPADGLAALPGDAQPSLLARDVGRTRDPLDRFFTPQALADLICAELAREFSPRVVVEPSVGGGAFVRGARKSWPRAQVLGVDVDPGAEGRHECDLFTCGDWPALRWRAGSADLAVGNPPFTGSTAIAHVEASLRSADVVALILPWAPLGGVGIWDHLMDGDIRPAWVRPITPRPWPKSVRETALFVWVRGLGGDTVRRRALRWKG